MKKITMPELKSATILKAAEMNMIHFGGNHSPLTPDRLKAIATSGKS
ncbi:MAG: hypothetical protein K2M27_02805 [Muribaculaceae bacterium]|nr:hypothetical protein [Muribaculaceae bacterium]